MRALLLLIALLPLAACNSIARLDSDSFAVGPGGVETFGNDDIACTDQAQTYTAYDLHVIGDDRYATNRAYNRAYAACMAGRGHARRTYARNWLPG